MDLWDAARNEDPRYMGARDSLGILYTLAFKILLVLEDLGHTNYCYEYEIACEEIYRTI